MNIAIINKETLEVIFSMKENSVIVHDEYILIEYPDRSEQKFVEIDGKVFLKPEYLIMPEERK